MTSESSSIPSDMEVDGEINSESEPSEDNIVIEDTDLEDWQDLNAPSTSARGTKCSKTKTRKKTSTPRTRLPVQKKRHKKSQINQKKPKDSSSSRQDLIAECAKHVHLQKEFYTVNYSKSSADGMTLIAKCTTCAQSRSGRIDVSSNFISHLRSQHPEVFQVFLQKRSKEIKKNSSGAKNKLGQQKFDTNIVNYILSSFAPLNTVHDPHFKKIFKDLGITEGRGRRLKLMSRPTVVSHMSKLLAEQITKIKEQLGSARYLCTTADIWSTNKRSFMGVTVHWIHPETLERHSAAISCRRFAGTHSYKRVANVLSAVHKNFEMKNVVATITDNASNFVKAFKVFGGATDFTTENDVDDDDDQIQDLIDPEVSVEEQEDQGVKIPNHLRCAAHTLNLVCTTDLNKILKNQPELLERHEKAISKCTLLWNKQRSAKQSEIISKHFGCSLVRPVITRWNSFYNAVKMVVNLEDRMTEEFYKELSVSDPLDDEDFQYLKEYVVCLEHIAGSLDLLQGDKHVFYGILTPTLVSLTFKLKALHKTYNFVYCKSMLDDLIDVIQKRFDKFFDITDEGENAAIAAVLHPKFKRNWLVSFPEYTKFLVKNLVNDAAQSVQVQIDETSDSIEDDFFVFAEANNDPVPERTPRTKILSEYLDSATTQNLDAVKVHPLITEMFLKYNTPLPSSAPIERVFSYSTMLNVAKFNRLSDKNFEARVLLKANMNTKI